MQGNECNPTRFLCLDISAFYSLSFLLKCHYFCRVFLNYINICSPNLDFFFFFLVSLVLHPWHMEVPRLGVQSEPQLLAHATATATAMPDPSRVCDLHHSPWQYWILNSSSEVRDRSYNPMVTNQIRLHCAMTGTPNLELL